MNDCCWSTKMDQDNCHYIRLDLIYPAYGYSVTSLDGVVFFFSSILSFSYSRVSIGQLQLANHTNVMVCNAQNGKVTPCFWVCLFVVCRKTNKQQTALNSTSVVVVFKIKKWWIDARIFESSVMLKNRPFLSFFFFFHSYKMMIFVRRTTHA